MIMIFKFNDFFLSKKDVIIIVNSKKELKKVITLLDIGFTSPIEPSSWIWESLKYYPGGIYVNFNKKELTGGQVNINDFSIEMFEEEVIPFDDFVKSLPNIIIYIEGKKLGLL